MSHDSNFCPFKQDTESTLFGKWLRAEDHSWNIPVWPTKSNISSNLKTVAVESLGNSSDEPMLQKNPQIKSCVDWKGDTVTETKKDSIKTNMADKSSSEEHLKNDMEVTEENISNTSVKISNGIIMIFDPGSKGDKLKRPREPNKEGIFIRKSRKVSNVSRPLEIKGFS